VGDRPVGLRGTGDQARTGLNPVEQPSSALENHRDQVQTDLIDQAGIQELLGRYPRRR
jgi:hypothetical protein